MKILPFQRVGWVKVTLRDARLSGGADLSTWLAVVEDDDGWCCSWPERNGCRVVFCAGGGGGIGLMASRESSGVRLSQIWSAFCSRMAAASAPVTSAVEGPRPGSRFSWISQVANFCRSTSGSTGWLAFGGGRFPCSRCILQRERQR